MANNIKASTLQPHWLGKTSAGALLGLSLALALSGIFAWLGPGGIDAPNKVQFNMWIMSPLWLTIFSFCYLFKTGLRAWLWLLLANIAGFGILFLTRYLHGAL